MIFNPLSCFSYLFAKLLLSLCPILLYGFLFGVLDLSSDGLLALFLVGLLANWLVTIISVLLYLWTNPIYYNYEPYDN